LKAEKLKNYIQLRIIRKDGQRAKTASYLLEKPFVQFIYE
jgi:hypothetical protein